MRSKLRTPSTIVLLAILSLRPAHAQEAATVDVAPDTSAALAEVTAAMQSLIDAKKVAGAVAIVSHRDKTIPFEAVGSRDISTGQPMQRDTIVRIYSMTKPITTTAAMMLVEGNPAGTGRPG